MSTTRYTFLASGARHPFTGVRLPVGEWIDGGVDRSFGVRCCDVTQLAHWVGDELWQVDVRGSYRLDAHSGLATHVRLATPMSAWNETAARAIVEAAAWRARDVVASRLAATPDGAGTAAHVAAARLRQAATLEELGAVSAALVAGEASAPAGASLDDRWLDPIGLLGEVADEARHAPPAVALLTATVAVAGWDVAAQEAERRWQSARIAEALGLDGG